MAVADREAILKEVVGRHPGIPKTDLQNRVQGYMAKDTASKMLEDLVKDGKVIRRKDGKKVRYFLRDALEDRLNKDLAAALDGYVKDLSAMKDEMETYPYDLLNVFNTEIPRQRDNLMRLKKRLEDELKFEHTVEDVMRDYDEMYGDIAKSLGMFQRLVDDNTKRKINECMTAMSGHLRQKATRQFELRTKRKSLGTGKTRDSLTKEINQLDLGIEEILVRAADLRSKLAYLKSRKPDELWGSFAPEPVRRLQCVGEERTRFQRLVEKALNAKIDMHDGEIEHWQDAEAELIRIMEQLSDMKSGLAKTEEVVIKSYIDADLYKQQKELSSLVEKTLEMYRP